jgi:VanZ family protein
VTRALWAYLPLGLWAVAVLVVGGLDVGAPSVPRGSDKVAHLVLYGVGGGLAAWAGRTRRHAASAWAGLGIVLLTGIADELHQGTLPHRTADIMDWAADAAGALVAFVGADRLLKKE